MGLYDPVDMTFYDGAGHLGRDSFNKIPNNVENAVWAHGVERPDFDGFFGLFGGGLRDYDGGSAPIYNWTRMNMTWDPRHTNAIDYPVHATHGALGGTPGYSPDRGSRNYNWQYDVQQSINVDTRIRLEAQGVGVPINVIAPERYGFPSTQQALPQVKERTWVEYWTALAGRFADSMTQYVP